MRKKLRTPEQRIMQNRITQRNYYHKNKFDLKLSVKSYRQRTIQGINDAVWVRATGKCEECHTNLMRCKGHFAIHHLNHNKLDNDLLNLRLLCVKCHLHIYHANDVKIS